MKKIGKFFMKNMIGILIGVLLSSVTVYATNYLYASSDVSYSNTTSELSATNVQDALDELYQKFKGTGFVCPEGYVCAHAATCKAGEYLKAGALTCNKCPEGKYCEGGIYELGKDIDQGITGTCKAGTYSEIGASSCTQCPAGKYSADAGASSCSTCTGNKTSAAGASSCTVACTNSTGVASWSTTATCTAATCNANYYRNGANCTACAGGKTTSAGNSSTSCSTCSNSANASTWSGLGCTIATCKSGYKVSSNKCVPTVCTVYCNKTSCSTSHLSGTHGQFTCNNGKTGGLEGCWYNSIKCVNTAEGYAWNHICTNPNYQGNKWNIKQACNSQSSAWDYGLAISNVSGLSCSCG